MHIHFQFFNEYVDIYMHMSGKIIPLICMLMSTYSTNHSISRPVDTRMAPTLLTEVSKNCNLWRNIILCLINYG